MVPMFVDPIAPALAAGVVVETWPILAGLAVVAVAAAAVALGLVRRDRDRRVDESDVPPVRKAA